MRLKLTAFVFLLALTNCKKDGEEPDPAPPPVVKYLLTSARTEGDPNEWLTMFEYDASNKLSVVKRSKLGVVTGDSNTYHYNDKNQLIRSVEYRNDMGTTPYEITKFYYNAAGQLTSDSAWDNNGYKCWHCFHFYNYDNKGRLLRYTQGSSFYRRFEYADGDNPVKSYMKPWDEDVDALEYEFLEFDKKQPLFGVDPAVRVAYRLFNFGNAIEYPMPAMANNVVKMKKNVYPYPNVIDIAQEITTEMEYNADGYPTKATLHYTKQFEYSDPGSRTMLFTYSLYSP